jgi:hypothetical protein
MGQDEVCALLRNQRKMNVLVWRRQLVIRADEAKQIEENTRVAHVEAQSQVRDCHRDTPVLYSSRLATERRDTCCRSGKSLYIENNLCHLLRQAAHSYIILILWVQREPRGARRGWRAERCHRRGDCCHRRRDKWDRRFHKSLCALSALAIEALSCVSINHDGITVFIILKEEVTRKGEGREKGRQSERHFG